MRKLLLLVIICLGIAGIYFITDHRPRLNSIYNPSLMAISSSAFVNDGEIPTKYTCLGANVSPPLQFSGVSSDARTLILVMDDPDAPDGTFTHWLVYNIPRTTKTVKEGENPPGTIANNSTGSPGYTGPCPDSGEHTYHFTLYAYDITPEESIRSRAQLSSSIHVLDKAELVGKFSRKK